MKNLTRTRSLCLLFVLLMASGCTLFSKSTSGSDEMVELTNEVLKKDEGVKISVEPIRTTKVKK